MSTPVQENFVSKNHAYAAKFSQGDLALPPAKHYLVLTCMDARIDPCSAFGIDLGDAHVIRNAGGSAKEALRSIIISQQLLNTKEILLIKHTECGMLTFDNDAAHLAIRKKLGDEAAAEIKDMDFLPFPELSAAVRDDLAFLRGSKAVPSDIVLSGWIYDVKHGNVTRVES